MPDAQSHLTPQELTAYRQGQLPEAAAAAVAEHLATCPACRSAAAPAPNLPPELADHPKFRVVRELGQGGMGIIYLAQHRVMDKPVALKVISPSVLDNATAVARFLGEVRAAGKLDHPNIARAYDADRAGSLHFLVMEYIDGMSLAQLLEQKGPLPVANACHYVRQAALGLHHAFEQGMVHRDLKPHNLMLTPRGLVKVLDFGLARLRDERQSSTRLTRLESFMGTPEYVAPEQATDARKADTRSDIYSLGCTLYALLAGRPPFVGESAVQVVLAHIENEPRPLTQIRPDVPAGLWAVVAKMLAKDPARRFQRPIDAAQALVPFIQAGTKAETAVVPTSLVTRPASGTVVGGDTPPEKRRGPEKSKSRPRKASREDQAEPAAAPVAWWARPPVIAGIICAVLGLAVVAGVAVLIIALVVGRDAAVAVAHRATGPARGARGAPAPHQEEKERLPAGEEAEHPAGPGVVPPENDKAPPSATGKAEPPKKAEDDEAAEARQREQMQKQEEARRRAQEKKALDDAARAKKAEEDRVRKQQEKEAAEVRKREEAKQKAETDAAAALKLAKKLIDEDARAARDAGNTAEERRLREEYPKALRELVKKYPETKAAKDAQELLDK
jgi:serine/threonine protein kinase